LNRDRLRGEHHSLHELPVLISHLDAIYQDLAEGRNEEVTLSFTRFAHRDQHARNQLIGRSAAD
jgi:hypothetical protein